MSAPLCCMSEKSGISVLSTTTSSVALTPEEKSVFSEIYQTILVYPSVWHEEDMLAPPGDYRLYTFNDGLLKYRNRSQGSDYTITFVYKSLPPYTVRIHWNVVTEEMRIIDSFIDISFKYFCWQRPPRKELYAAIESAAEFFVSESVFTERTVEYSSDTSSSDLLSGSSVLSLSSSSTLETVPSDSSTSCLSSCSNKSTSSSSGISSSSSVSISSGLSKTTVSDLSVTGEMTGSDFLRLLSVFSGMSKK